MAQGDVDAAAYSPPADTPGPEAAAGAAVGVDVAAIICSVPWPCAEALAVAQCESSLNPGAYSQGNYGLMQVNAIHAWRVGGNLDSLFDPEVNVQVAYQIWVDNAGWGPWACKPY